MLYIVYSGTDADGISFVSWCESNTRDTEEAKKVCREMRVGFMGLVGGKDLADIMNKNNRCLCGTYGNGGHFNEVGGVCCPHMGNTCGFHDDY